MESTPPGFSPVDGYSGGGLIVERQALRWPMDPGRLGMGTVLSVLGKGKVKGGRWPVTHYDWLISSYGFISHESLLIINLILFLFHIIYCFFILVWNFN